MTRADIILAAFVGTLFGFWGAIEAHAIDPPSNWLNARTLAVGRIGGTDMEIETCYFQIGLGAMLVLHPKGEACPLARELVGRTGRLIFLPD